MSLDRGIIRPLLGNAVTNHKTYDSGRNYRATRFMLVVVLGYSIIPVFIAVMDTHRASFLFTAFMYVGQFVGIGAYILWTYPALFFRRNMLRAMVSRLTDPMFLLTLTGYLNYAFYSWSTQYIDPAVTTAIFGGWTFATVLFLGWIFKSEQRYERVSIRLVAVLLIGFLGFVLAVLSQREDLLASDRDRSAAIEVGLGVLLAAVSMLMAALGSFVLKWGVETGRTLSYIAASQYDLEFIEVAGVLTGITLAAAIAVPANFAIGLARGESLAGIAALDFATASVVGLISLGFCTILFRRANLMTRNLGIIGMTYATLPLSLVWMTFLDEIAVERPLFLAIGAALVVASNVLVHLLGNRTVQKDPKT